VTLQRMRWERFLATSQADLRAHDDYGSGRPTFGSTANPSTSSRSSTPRNQTAATAATYPASHPRPRSAREAVGWTFRFENADDYILEAASCQSWVGLQLLLLDRYDASMTVRAQRACVDVVANDRDSIRCQGHIRPTREAWNTTSAARSRTTSIA